MYIVVLLQYYKKNQQNVYRSLFGGLQTPLCSPKTTIGSLLQNTITQQLRIVDHHHKQII